jgi:hypothetical protein
MSGGLIFFLSVAFAFATGGGFPAFFIMLFLLSAGGGILQGIQRQMLNNGYRQPPRRRVADRQTRARLRQTARMQLPAQTGPSRTARPSGRSLGRAYPHATEAVRRAGIDPERARLTVSDLGLIVYTGASRPAVHREAAVPDTADYVRPFVELQAERPARGTLTFEIVDASGEVVYRREEAASLREGSTPIIPRTWLPIGDHYDMTRAWTLRIYANDTLLAEHPIGWFDPTNRTETLREVMSNDGEISADLSALMENPSMQPMSLEDLLGDDLVVSASSRRS